MTFASLLGNNKKSMATVTKSFAQRHWALGLMLLSLHGVLIWGFEDPLQKALLLCHYGLFLIWQPIWRNEQK
ncbi:MAG TPA: sensor histidine kinase, partial [Methylophilaceae bacterium]|nr:sensor histidine kinase [Methylophilaceae bacterium]